MSGSEGSLNASDDKGREVSITTHDGDGEAHAFSVSRDGEQLLRLELQTRDGLVHGQWEFLGEATRDSSRVVMTVKERLGEAEPEVEWDGDSSLIGDSVLAALPLEDLRGSAGGTEDACVDCKQVCFLEGLACAAACGPNVLCYAICAITAGKCVDSCPCGS